eukprot:5265006-Karenia_brevis.AAC.1
MAPLMLIVHSLRAKTMIGHSTCSHMNDMSYGTINLIGIRVPMTFGHTGFGKSMPTPVPFLTNILCYGQAA